ERAIRFSQGRVLPVGGGIRCFVWMGEGRMVGRVWELLGGGALGGRCPLRTPAKGSETLWNPAAAAHLRRGGGRGRFVSTRGESRRTAAGFAVLFGWESGGWWGEFGDLWGEGRLGGAAAQGRPPRGL